MKDRMKRIIAMLCAICLITSGEGSLCLTALADVVRTGTFATESVVSPVNAAARLEAIDGMDGMVHDGANGADGDDSDYDGVGHTADSTIVNPLDDTISDAHGDTADASPDSTIGGTADNTIGDSIENAFDNTVLSKSVLTTEWDIYRIKVTYDQSSGIPEDAELVVRELTEESDENYAQYLAAGVGMVGLDNAGLTDGSVSIAKAFDISLRSKTTGEEYQPSNDMKVEISLPTYKLTDEMQVGVVHFAEKLSEELQEELRQEAYANFSDEEREVYEGLTDEERTAYAGMSEEERTVYVDLSEEERPVYAGLSEGERVQYVELPEEERQAYADTVDIKRLVDEEILNILNSIPRVMDIELDKNTAGFITDGFSVFVVLGYTVDFHWGDYTFNMEGGTDLLLSELLEAIVANADGDAAEAEEILDDFSIIRDVRFSNPELLTVEKVDLERARQILKERAQALTLTAEDDEASGEPEAIDQVLDTSWQDYDREEDWLMTSLQSFESEEKLTIILRDGRMIDIHVTDPQTVTYQGFIYSINNQKTAATITKRASGYNNLSKTAVLPGTINGVKVVSAPYQVFPAGSSTLVEESYVNTLFPAAINVPDLIVTNPEVEALNNDANVRKGADNDTSMTQVWKKSEVNAEGNIEITISFFQKQGKPIDFILVCDETGSMANAATAEVDGTKLTAPRFMWARAAILKATRALMDANHKDIPYNNEVAFLVWDNRAQLYSDFYNDFDAANNWMKNQYTGHNGTNHTQTIQTLLGMVDRRKKANAASGRNAEIVIVYLSDFADGGEAADRIVFNGVRDEARKHFNANATIYGLNMFGGTVVNSRQKLISRQGHNYVSGSDPSKLLPAFEQIINDAISNADAGMTIEDELSPALVGQAEANKSSLDGGSAADSSNNTSSEAATYDDGTLSWDLSNGKTTQTIEGQTVTSTKTLRTGQVYHKTITIPITDAGWGDNVYSGQMPTNGSLVLKDKDGNPINSVGVEDGKDGSPIAKTPVKFKLCMIDTAGNQTGYAIEPIRFTLVEQGSTDTPKEYTTGSDGVFTVPYEGSNSISFEKGKTYVLTEVTSSVNDYNRTDPVHMVFAPIMKDLVNDEAVPSHWLLTVNDDYSISTRIQDEADTSYTPALTISTGTIRIWNNERIDAKLIPITVTKTWAGNGPRFDVPFTIYGLDESGRYPLTAFSSSDEETAQVVASLKESEVSKTSSSSGEIWSREVYVYSKVGTHEFYTSVMVKTVAGHNYTPSMSGKEKFETQQSYSYTIEEGEFPDEYKYGYYHKETPTTTRIDSQIVDNYSVSTDGRWVDIGNSNDYFLAQLHINVSSFKLVDDITYGNSGTDDYKKNASNEMINPKKLYTHLQSVELEVHSAVSGETVTKSRMTFDVNDVPDSHDGVLFQGIRLPKEWENYYTTNGGVIGSAHACNYTDLIIDKLTFIDDKGNRIDMQGGNNILHYGLYYPKDESSILRLAIEKNGTNTGAHKVTVVSNSSFNNITSNQKYIESSSTSHKDTYNVSSLVFGLTNSEIPLQEVELRKTWNLNGHYEQLPSDDILTTWVYGKKSSGESTGHVLPVYLSSDRSDNNGNGYRPYDLHVDEGTRTTEWRDTIYLPEYEVNPNDITGYTATEEEMVVKEDTDSDATPDVYGIGLPGEWEELNVTYGQESGTRKVIDVVGVPAWTETTYDPSNPTGTYYTKYIHIKTSRELLIGGFLDDGVDVTSITLTWVVGGKTYTNTISTNVRMELSTLVTPRHYYIPLQTSMSSIGTLSSIRLNNNSSLDSLVSMSDSGVLNTLPWNTSISAQGTSTETLYHPEIPEQSHMETYNVKVLSLTNTFSPYGRINIVSKFFDETDDSESTLKIQNVRYHIADTSSSAGYDIGVPVSATGVNTIEGNSGRYLPFGNYTITQVGYDLQNSISVNIDPNYNPYAVTITNATQDSTKITGSFVSNAGAAGGLNITFENTRKNYPVTVQMEWHPGLDTGEDPLKENDPSQSKAEYTLQYYSLVGGTGGNGGFKNTEQKGVLSARTPTQHDGAVPVFSVDGRPLKCDLGGEDTVEARLPDYDLTILTEEVPTGNAAAPTRLIYTFRCDLKQTRLSVNKTWYFEDSADKSARDALDEQSVTLTLKRVDGKAFRIGDASMTEKVIKLPADGSVIDDLTWGIDLENIDVSKSYLPDSAYVLEETRIGTGATSSAAFEPVYEDVIPSEAHEFTVTKVNKHDKDAHFRLIRTVAKGEPDPGTIISVTNREITTSFTVKKLWKDIIGNEVDAASVKSELAMVELYGIKYSTGTNHVTIPGSYKDQNSAISMLNGHAGNSLVNGNMKLRDFGDYQINADNLKTEGGKSIWSLTIDDLPASYTYYVVERSASGEELATFELYKEGANDGRLKTAAKTDEADQFKPEYAYTPATSTEYAYVVITNTLPYICKIEEKVTIGGEEVIGETPFATLNKAVNYARLGTNYTMDANNPVAIQMLVDYAIPESDKVALDRSTDNITITTAKTSGGTYNFLTTFGESSGRKAEDSKSVGLLTRDANFNNASLFTVSNSAKFATENIIFDGRDISTSLEGGIVKVSGGTMGVRSGTQFRNSKAADGGAVWISEGSTATFNGGELKDCTATGNGGGICNLGTLEMTDTAIRQCVAAADGGGIYSASTSTSGTDGFAVNMTEVTIDGGTSTQYAQRGGAVFVKVGKLSMTDCTIVNEKAPTGAAIFVGNNDAGNSPAEVTISGGNITNCTATVKDGGAINVDKEGSVLPKVYFEGDVVVFNNFNTADDTGHQHNMVLGADSNGVIRTTAKGLHSDAHVGVYVTGTATSEKTAWTEPYKTHGNWKKNFGTFDGTLTEGVAKGKQNLAIFTNDRNLGLYGEENTDESGSYIRWRSYVCKITDSSGNVLYKKSDGQPAIYNYLSGTDADDSAFGALRAGREFTDKDGNDAVPAQVMMLVPEHAIGTGDWNRTHAVVPDMTLVLTTATRDEADGFDYVGDKDTVAELYRGQYNKEMFVLVGDDVKLTVKDITVDGRESSSTTGLTYSEDHTALFTVEHSDAQLILDSGATLRNGASKKWSSIYVGVADDPNLAGKHPKIEMKDGALIENCVSMADSVTDDHKGGAVYVTKNGTFTMTGGQIIGAKDSSGNMISSAQFGGAAYVDSNGIMNMSGGSITECRAESKGGAVYLANGSTMNFTGGLVTSNTVVSAGDGAGIYLDEDSKLNLSGSPRFAGSYKDSTGTDQTSEGNFKQGTLSGKTNGGQTYEKARQDVFIKGYFGKASAGSGDPKMAISLRVTGKLTDPSDTSKVMAKGSIWVWSEVPATDEEDNHYLQLKQFARFYLPEGVTLTEDEKTAVMEVFRNAVSDDLTEAGEALYGQFSDDDTGNPRTYIYWSGVAGYQKVIIRKIGKNYETLSGAKFTVRKGTSDAAYIWKDRNDKTKTQELKDLASLKSGIFWVGELPYGTYYLEETEAPKDAGGNIRTEYSDNVGKWFCLIVDETGTWMSKLGYKTTDSYAGDSSKKGKDAALLDATAVKPAPSSP